MNRYITKEVEDDVLTYLGEWKTGRYGKKLTWTILVKSFGYSRQALSGNAKIKSAYDDAKNTLKGAASEIDALSDIAKDNKRLSKELQEAKELIHEYEQKYMRWQINAQLRGVSVDALNKPVQPSMREEMRKMQEK